MHPHWDQTRAQIEARPAVLLVQDTTDVDLSHHPKTSGVGQIGTGQGSGLYLQTVLALVRRAARCWAARSKSHLCARQPQQGRREANDASATREKRTSGCGWFSAWAAIQQTHWWCMWAIAEPICSRFLRACQATQTHFLVRGFENRRLQPEEETQAHLLDEVRRWPTMANRPLQVPASHRRTARLTMVQLAFGHLTVLAPRFETRCGQKPLSLWAVRVWEEYPQPEKSRWNGCC